MITYQIMGYSDASHGGSYGDAVNDAIMNLKSELESYENITFVEVYDKGEVNGARYIFSVEGYDDYYLTFESRFNVNTDMSMRIYEKDNVYSDNPIWEYTISASGQSGYYAFILAYIISENNKIKAITCSPLNAVPSDFFVFSEKYIYYNKKVYDIINKIKYDVNTQQLPAYTIPEQALRKTVIITSGNASTSPFIDVYNDILFVVNSQFSNMTLACIDINGIRYRQIASSCLFIKDTE